MIFLTCYPIESQGGSEAKLCVEGKVEGKWPDEFPRVIKVTELVRTSPTNKTISALI